MTTSLNTALGKKAKKKKKAIKNGRFFELCFPAHLPMKTGFIKTGSKL